MIRFGRDGQPPAAKGGVAVQHGIDQPPHPTARVRRSRSGIGQRLRDMSVATRSSRALMPVRCSNNR